jgi:hypothetical protein
MAVTTGSDPIRLVDTGVYSFYGYRIPENVTYVEMIHDVYGGYVIRWVSKPNASKHSIDFPHPTEENILAVLAAMRLSC